LFNRVHDAGIGFARNSGIAWQKAIHVQENSL